MYKLDHQDFIIVALERVDFWTKNDQDRTRSLTYKDYLEFFADGIINFDNSLELETSVGFFVDNLIVNYSIFYENEKDVLSDLEGDEKIEDLLAYGELFKSPHGLLRFY